MSDGCFFLTRQTDHALQDFGFLRARKSMAAIKQEAWDPGYAHLMGNPVFLRYGIRDPYHPQGNRGFRFSPRHE